MYKVIISSHSRYPVDRKVLRQQTVDFLSSFGLSDDYLVHILFAGDRKMTSLNQRYLKKTGTTDVLSFPLLELDRGRKSSDVFWPKENDNDKLDLGEVVVCYPEAKRKAMAKGITLDSEIEFLVKHGLKHLLGYHHK